MRANLLRAFLRRRRPVPPLTYTGSADTPSRTVLPFAIDIPVRSYLNHAFPLSIVAADSNHVDALYASFIQMFFPDNKLEYDRVLMLPSLMTPDWERLGFLETTVLDSHDERFGRHESLVNALVDLINQGQYIELHIDEYFLPGRPLHDNTHSVHDNLILGFDLSARVFVLAGYGRDYELAAIGFEDIARAFHHMPRTELKRRFVRTIRPRPRAAASFDLAGMISQLEDYVASRPTISPEAMRRADLYWQARRFTGTWGLDAYDAFIEYLLRTSRDGKLLDLRVTRTLWEHKACMLARLKYLESRRLFPNGRRFSRRYAPIEELATTVRFEAYEFNVCGQAARHIDAMVATLRTMREAEAPVLRDVVASLSSASRAA
jgi:hypothetical protein